jgi:hypothetical protein
MFLLGAKMFTAPGALLFKGFYVPDFGLPALEKAF